MKPERLGAVVAERKLDFVRADGSTIQCTVSVGTPVPDENGDWCCPYELRAGDDTILFAMHGVDSMQALIGTLKTLDGEVSRMAKKFEAEVRYLDGSHDSVFNP
ncbi:MAG TPA: hypothetical protein PKK10_09270 [Woeseiaceae bacterium]|nr:hypothetical protein [Woeseiaceae bacterium]